MKKLILLFVSLLAIGSIFQSCSSTKTYAEMLEEEKNAVNAYIQKYGIKVISTEAFEKDSTTDLSANEYVAFSNGVYLQIVDKGSENKADTFKTNNLVITRFLEVDMVGDDTTGVSNVLNPVHESLNLYPDGFRYTDNGTSIYGQFVSEAGLGINMLRNYGTAVPAGWLIALKYVRDGAHVKLIVPSKLGHQSAQEDVIPFFYDIRKFSIY